MNNMCKKFLSLGMVTAVLLSLSTGAMADGRRDVIEGVSEEEISQAIEGFFDQYYDAYDTEQVPDFTGKLEYCADTADTINQLKYINETNRQFGRKFNNSDASVDILDIREDGDKIDVIANVTHEYRLDNAQRASKNMVVAAVSLEEQDGELIITKSILQGDGEVEPSMADLQTKLRSPFEEPAALEQIESSYETKIDSISDYKEFFEAENREGDIVPTDDRIPFAAQGEIDYISTNRREPLDITRNYNASRAAAYASYFAYGDNNIFRREENDCTGFVNAAMWTGYCGWTDDTLFNSKDALKTLIANKTYFGSNWYGQKYGSTSFSSGPWMRVIEIETEMKKTSGTGARGNVYNWSSPSGINNARVGDIIQFYFNNKWSHSGIVVSADVNTQYNASSIYLAMHSTDNDWRGYNELCQTNKVTNVRLIRPTAATLTS